MIDELPVLAVAATQMPGTSVIAGARELRVKESDRIAAMDEGLTAMGADITAIDDGWVINGPRRLEGARVESHGDHRVAMALAVAGLIADGDTEIEGAECVEISYPGFFDHLEYLMLKVRCEIDIEFVALELYELEVTDAARGLRARGRADDAGGARPATVGDVGRARELYRRFGVDPTRVRPSSEALLRRLKKGEPLPRVNSLVDVANAMSVQLQVPVGLYDLDKVKGDELVDPARRRGRGLHRNRQGARQRRRAASASPTPRALRQPERRLGAHDDHHRHRARRVDLLPARDATTTSTARRSSSPCSGADWSGWS